ncbi:MAG: alpha/beta hydrolase [Pseudomonadota bacterium]
MKNGLINVDEELQMYFQETGNGSVPILLLPGWTMSTDVFEKQFSFFEDSADYRFVSLDPRAHGRSTKTHEGHYYEQHGRDLHACIEALALENFVLGGWSFGCLATLSYIHQFGFDRLARFIMLDGPPRAAGTDNENDWVTYTLDDADGQQEFYSLGKLRDSRATNLEFAHWMLEERSQATVDWLVSITEQMPDSAACLLNATSVFLDYRETLIDVANNVPSLYYVRESQRAIVESWAQMNTPTARVHASGEHLMFWERADEFNSTLVDFIQPR